MSEKNSSTIDDTNLARDMASAEAPHYADAHEADEHAKYVGAVVDRVVGERNQAITGTEGGSRLAGARAIGQASAVEQLDAFNKASAEGDVSARQAALKRDDFVGQAVNRVAADSSDAANGTFEEGAQAVGQAARETASHIRETSLADAEAAAQRVREQHEG